MLCNYFKGKRVMVTGAGRGIGKAFVHRLHSYGAEVIAVSKTEANLKQLKREIPSIKTVWVDLGNWVATRESLSQIPAVHFLVNNAGILKPQTLLEITAKDFADMMNVNVGGVLNVTQIVVAKMITEEIHGYILNISSTVSSYPFWAQPSNEAPLFHRVLKSCIETWVFILEEKHPEEEDLS